MKRTLVRALGLVAAVGTEILSARPCPAPRFTDPSQVNLTARTAVIVTHASTQWDYYQSSKYGMDKKNLPLPRTHRAVVQVDGVSRFLAAGSRSDGPVLTVNFVLSQSPNAYFWK